MPFDYKKEYKEFYMPKNKPSIVEVPTMNFIAVKGKGDPNVEGGEYKQSIGLLYAIAFTIKMSKLGSRKIDGYFDYVVPPLEGLWRQATPAGNTHTDLFVKESSSPATQFGVQESLQEQSTSPFQVFDELHKGNLSWISLIRLPDFVKREDFDWAIEEASRKKKTDFSKVEFFTYSEGVCVQCMHIGSYDDEPKTIELMHELAEKSGYEIHITDSRFHHEIYLSDPRRVKTERLKTVIRLPVKKI